MATDEIGPLVSSAAGGVRLRVKVVPGARRTRIAGVLGDRLKVSVSAPPEAGKANRALCELLAKVFEVPTGQVTVVSGGSSPRKMVEIVGVAMGEAVTILGRCVEDGD